MLQGAGNLHQYSCWFADAVYKRYLVNPDTAYLISLLADLQDYFRKWEVKEKDGLFHYTPWMDGMEYSISGNLEERYRPTLNSYMYAEALAISNVARIAGDTAVADLFTAKASTLKSNVQAKLWDPALSFFATQDENGNFTPI